MTNKKIDSLAKALGVLTFKSKITFGKYKRKTLEFVVENDPDYIIWLVENTHYVIDKRVILAAGKEVLSRLEIVEAIDIEADFDMKFSLEDTF